MNAYLIRIVSRGARAVVCVLCVASLTRAAFLCDVDGVGVNVCGSKLASDHFADDGVGIATTATGMHHLLRRQVGYMDDAPQKFNFENKATVIMCFSRNLQP